MVDSGKNGFIFDSQKNLVEKLILLHDNNESRLKMGLLSKVKSKEFSIKKVVNELEKNYQHLFS